MASAASGALLAVGWSLSWFDVPATVPWATYLLSVLEYGWDTRLRDLGWRVYRAQERRFEEKGARSRWSSVMFSSMATSGRNVTMSSSWNELISATYSGFGSSATCLAKEYPMLPTSAQSSPATWHI